VKSYYESKGVKIFQNKDQDTSDLEKCLYYVFENSESLTQDQKKDSPKNVLTVDNFNYSKLIILGAFGGKICQTLLSIHILYKMYSFFQEKCRENEMILMDDNSMMIFLEAGNNYIRTSKKYELNEGCSLIPLCHKVKKIKTSGLKFNLGNSGDRLDYLDFSEVLQTSNAIQSEEVIVTNSHPVLFTTCLNKSWF